MFLSVEIPLCDVRTFLTSPTNKLGSPAWPIPQPQKEFVRGFGLVERRRRGGDEHWLGEHMFCGAARALRFGPQLSAYDLGLGTTALSCVFRRLFSTGGCVSRVEVGFKLRGKSTVHLDGTDSLALINNCCAVPIRIPQPNGHGIRTDTLIRSLPGISNYYLNCSTQRSATSPTNTQSWWLSPGEPMILVEHRHREIVSFPKFTRRVSLLENDEVRVCHCKVDLHGRPLGAWFIGYSDKTNHDSFRRLRIHLVRLHAERECLKQTLRLLAQGQIKVVPGTESSNNLQAYLRDSVTLLSETDRFGINQQDVLAAAQQFDAMVSPGERETVLSELGKARRHVFLMVERFTAEQAARLSSKSQPINVIGGVVNYGVIEHAEGGSMTKYEVKFGDNAKITGDLVVANSIQNSFNKVSAASDISPDIRANLKTLAEALADASNHMPPEMARQAASDLEAFTSEAISPKPRRKWYELTGSGLIEAAKTVGEIGVPIVKTVTALLGLLGA